MPNTPRGYPYPSGQVAPNVPYDIQALANAVDADVAQLAESLESTDWTDVTPAPGFTAFNAQVRRVSGEVRFRGYLQGSLTTATKVVGTVPTGYRAPGGNEDTGSVVRLGSGAAAGAAVAADGAITVIAPTNATTAVYLKGLSGYQVTS